jgi:multidrug resistance efflux pump
VALTLAEAQADYDKIKSAYLKALEAQSYGVQSHTGGRNVQRADVAELKRQLDACQAQINRLTIPASGEELSAK